MGDQLHYNEYPGSITPSEFSYTSGCKFTAKNRLPYQGYDNSNIEASHLNQCHVEVCHPGSWESKGCSSNNGVSTMMMMKPSKQNYGNLRENFCTDYSPTYLIFLAILAAAAVYFIARRRFLRR